MPANNNHRAKSAWRKLSAGLTFVVAASTISLAQMAAGTGNEMQQKLAALKQSAAANKEKLRHYQWVETRQVTLKGEQKPEQVFQCTYGPNGQVQRVPLSAQPQAQQSGRRRGGGALRQHIVEKKTEEMKQYMQEVTSLLALYVPPNPQLMQQAIQKKNVAIEKNMGSSGVEAVFQNYAKQGDKMTIGFDPATRKITSINVNTYMDEPKDAVTLAVQMASLPDGANYAQQSVLNATAKQLQVTTTNSNYVKIQ
ncbi:MAG TPA: hypothetical protein VKV05_03945 [Terriglobales bacterium]|nr:hypothetical protein [Terriglobales bacterium]